MLVKYYRNPYWRYNICSQNIFSYKRKKKTNNPIEKGEGMGSAFDKWKPRTYALIGIPINLNWILFFFLHTLTTRLESLDPYQYQKRNTLMFHSESLIPHNDSELFSVTICMLSLNCHFCAAIFSIYNSFLVSYLSLFICVSFLFNSSIQCSLTY